MICELPLPYIRQFSEIIWNNLQNEAFNSFDESVQTECVNTIALLCSVLTSSKERFGALQFDSITEKVISEVLEKCQDEITKDPDTLTGIMAGNMLSEIMKKSQSLCAIIIEKFVVNFCIESINQTNIKNV